MAIQILGLRDYVDKKSGKLKKRHVFHEKGWRAPDVETLLKNIDEIIKAIPKEDRVNLYFTAADCFEGGEIRKLKEQWILPFDIDDIGVVSTDPEEIKKTADKVLEVACGELNLDINKVAALFSGNGLQFFVRLEKPIMSEEYFDTMREQYKIVCDKIQAKLTLQHLSGKVDSSVFSAARLLRLPNTWNEKPKKGKKWAFLIRENLEPQAFHLEEITGDAEIKKADTVAKEVFKKYSKPDQKNILKGCEFLKWCKDKPNDVSEHQWYAMIGVTAFLPDGEQVTHEYSQSYTGYDPQETQEKFDQAIRASGPRTCKDIGARWNGCKSCAHYGVVTSPIVIKGEDYIATKDTGFREVKISENGKPSPGKVAMEDLVKQFALEHEYAKVDKNGMYIYHPETKKWMEYSEDRMRSWCRDKVFPKPSSGDMIEFVKRMQSHSIKPNDWLDGSDNRHINFNNGVLDRQTKELKPHASEYGFKYVLPFDYNPYAKAPRFAQFLDEITGGDKETQELLKQFGGYCLSGDEYWSHKALLLVGEGSNGKSVFMETLATLAGEGNYSATAIKHLGNPVYCYALVNKLFNYSEESNIYSFKDSDIFKAVTSGGAVKVKQLYSQPFEYKNKAKVIVACNELPTSFDVTHGMFRRLILVKLDRIFRGKDKDPFLKKKLVDEASGIYNLLLDAYAKAKDNLVFSVPKKSEELLDEYKKMSDVEILFMDACLKPSEGSVVKNVDLYTAYVSFCERNGFKNRIKSSISFAKRIGHLDIRIDKNRDVIKEDGKAYRVIRGFSVEQEY